MTPPNEPRPKAVLVAVHLPDANAVEFRSSLDELARLVTTLGYDVVGEITQTRSHLAASAVIGEGKLVELGDMTGGSGEVGTTAPPKKDKARQRREASAKSSGDVSRAARESSHDVNPGYDGDDDDGEYDDDGDDAYDDDAPKKVQLVAVDHDISPSQARNLERATGVTVLDRTGVIIDIFHRHAKSREARLQVEIARLAYTAPRLRESPGGKERQRGKGAGEAALELDRRKIRDRIAELREELHAIGKEQNVRRAHRKDARRIALVGYTNAGKSSLMRALTGSQVYVENKLFATLDTTVRALHPEVKPRILVSDTVGFIKKLPHDLVASFKSTLDEAHEASHLLHVVDASDPGWEAQLKVTQDVLAEIGADEVASTLVLNKCDLVDAASRDRLARRFPDAWLVSAHRKEDIVDMHARIVQMFEASYLEEELRVPYTRQALVSEMHETGRVVSEQYDDEGVLVTFRAAPEDLARLRAKLGA